MHFSDRLKLNLNSETLITHSVCPGLVVLLLMMMIMINIIINVSRFEFPSHK